MQNYSHPHSTFILINKKNQHASLTLLLVPNVHNFEYFRYPLYNILLQIIYYLCDVVVKFCTEIGAYG